MHTSWSNYRFIFLLFLSFLMYINSQKLSCESLPEIENLKDYLQEVDVPGDEGNNDNIGIGLVTVKATFNNIKGGNSVDGIFKHNFRNDSYNMEENENITTLNPILTLKGTIICYELKTQVDGENCGTLDSESTHLEDILLLLDNKYGNSGRIMELSKSIELNQLLQKYNIMEEKRKSQGITDGNNEEQVYYVKFIASLGSYSYIKKGLTLYFEKPSESYDTANVKVEMEVEKIFAASPIYSPDCLSTTSMFLINMDDENEDEDGSRNSGQFIAFPIAPGSSRNLSLRRNTLISLYERKKVSTGRAIPSDSDKIITDGKIYRTYFPTGSDTNIVSDLGYLIDFEPYSINGDIGSTTDTVNIKILSIPNDLTKYYGEIYQEKIPQVEQKITKLGHCISLASFQMLEMTIPKNTIVKLNYKDQIQAKNIKHTNRGSSVNDAEFFFTIIDNSISNFTLVKELKDCAVVQIGGSEEGNGDEEGKYELYGDTCDEEAKTKYEKTVRKIMDLIESPFDSKLQDHLALNSKVGTCDKSSIVPCFEYLKVVRAENSLEKSYFIAIKASKIFKDDYPNEDVCMYGSIKITVDTVSFTDPPYGEIIDMFEIKTPSCRGDENTSYFIIIGILIAIFLTIIAGFVVVMIKTPVSKPNEEDFNFEDNCISQSFESLEEISGI